MTRRFRRRPSTTVSFLLALAAVILARSLYDRVVDRPSHTAVGCLNEGGCEVVRVIDGDSIVVRQPLADAAPGKRATCEATLRLLAIDCPELDEPLGAEAAAMTRRLLDEGAVRLRLDRRRLDQAEGFLAYVFADDHLVNASLVRAGLARADRHPGDSQSIGRVLGLAEADAKAAGRGIWRRAELRP